MRWAATDDVGVTSYEVQLRRGAAAWTRIYLGTSVSRTFSLPLGHIDIRIRASDAAGNDSAWRSASRSTVVSDLIAGATRSHSASWVADTARRTAWSGTRYVTSEIGEHLTIRTDGRGVALVAQQGTSGGRLAILIDGVQVAVVDLAADATRDRRVVWAGTWPTRAVRTIGIRTLDSPGADTVWLDAVA